MPLIFSYGTLQNEDVQRKTYGRRLEGQPDALPCFAPALVKIDDAEVVAALGKTHHANAAFTGNVEDHVTGMAFEISDDELTRTDGYEAPFAYRRIEADLASGRRAWVYVHRPGDDS